jgi:hypothetical protein
MEDVSEFDATPRLSLRGCLVGARPLAGGLGAGGLKLLACSWFALGVGGLGLLPKDSGAHRTVQIAAESPRADAGGQAARQLDLPFTTALPRRAAPRVESPSVIATEDATPGGDMSAAPPAAATESAPAPGGALKPSAPAASVGPSADSSLSETPPPTSVVDPVPPVLPTAPDPPIVPPLPVPLPVSVPDVTAVTGELGLP